MADNPQKFLEHNLDAAMAVIIGAAIIVYGYTLPADIFYQAAITIPAIVLAAFTIFLNVSKKFIIASIKRNGYRKKQEKVFLTPIIAPIVALIFFLLSKGSLILYYFSVILIFYSVFSIILLFLYIYDIVCLLVKNNQF